MSTVPIAASAEAADRPKIQSRSYAIPLGWQSVLTGLNWIITSSVLSLLSMILIIVQVTGLMREYGRPNDAIGLREILSILMLVIAMAEIFFNLLGLGLSALVPKHTNSRPAIYFCVISVLLGTYFFSSTLFSILTMETQLHGQYRGNIYSNAAVSTMAGSYVLVGGMIVAGFVYTILFVMFLISVANYLKRSDIAMSLHRFLITSIIVLLFTVICLLVISQVMARSGPTSGSPVYLTFVLIFIFVANGFVTYLFIKQLLQVKQMIRSAFNFMKPTKQFTASAQNPFGEMSFSDELAARQANKALSQNQ
jgi:hypothetical protein